MAAQLPQLFGLIPTSHPCITLPTSAPSQTSYIYTLPPYPKPFNYITVFLLPGITLPPNTAAAVYILLPATSSPSPQPNFKFLGGIGEGKESAVFKISGFYGSAQGIGNGGEVDMDAPDDATQGNGSGSPEITLGISLESAESVAQQMAQLQSNTSTTNPSSALVPLRAQKPAPDTLLLAQRIIKNAFNFLASFSGNTSGGIEVVPLKAFEEWWRKFEGRVRSDPTFLERDGD